MRALKHPTLLALLLSLLMGTGCQAQVLGEAQAASSDASSRRKVIIDTDTGADDAAALILAARCADIDILGVTVLVGNVDLEKGTQNALMALETAGSSAPVYKGASENYSGEPIQAFSVFGEDGMGDAGLIHPSGKAEDEDAVDFILETVEAYPDEVELIVLGPATNIAKAIERAPETMRKVRMIWSMGSAGLGPGNASPVAEFNVYADPYAYKTMLDFGVPVTVVGLDMCNGKAQWTDEQFDALSSLNDTGRFVADSFQKIRGFYAINGSAGSVMNCDTLAITCALYPDFVKSVSRCHGSCITDPGETFAQVIFYQEGFIYDVVSNDFDYNVTLITEVEKENYFNLFLSAIA